MTWLYIWEDHEGKEGGPDSSSSPALRQRTRPDGPQREGLWLKDKETLVDDRIRHTHTAVAGIVRHSLAVSSLRRWNVWLSASRALETWCHCNKCALAKEKQLFMCSGPQNEKWDTALTKRSWDIQEWICREVVINWRLIWCYSWQAIKTGRTVPFSPATMI